MEKEKTKTAEEIFTGNFSIWAISTRAAAFKARLSAEDLKLDPGEIDDNITLGVKNMIPDEDRIKLNAAPGMVQNFMRSVSRRFFGRGLYAVPESKILAAQYGLTKIQEEIKKRVEEFISRYPETKAAQIERHPNLKGEQWPTPNEIRRFYSLSWKVFSITALEIKGSDPEELTEAKERFQAELKAGYDALKDEILGQSYMEILSAIETITAKIEESERNPKAPKITETNFKRPKAVLDQYLSIAAVFDLPEIEAKIKAVKEAMTTPAKDLREKPLVSKIFAEKMKDLSKDIEAMTGYSKTGRLKRELDLDDDTQEAEEPKAANG